jgi:hypothetical protein
LKYSEIKPISVTIVIKSFVSLRPHPRNTNVHYFQNISTS